MKTKPKRKEKYINDSRRLSYLRVIYNRIYWGQSVLLEGDYGVGKSQFLKLIQPNKRRRVRVESLDNIHEILASILHQLNFEALPSHFRTSKYLKMICELSGFVIIIDEANDLDRRVWPYFKRMIDAEIPLILAGLPKVRTFLKSQHPDILSRVKTLVMYPIVLEDFILEYKDFQAEALEQIYVTTKGDMRKFKEICADCRDMAKQRNDSFVSVKLAMSFLSDFPIDEPIPASTETDKQASLPSPDSDSSPT